MDGKVVADGTHEELLATNASYREVLARAEAEELQAVADDEVRRRATIARPSSREVTS